MISKKMSEALNTQINWEFYSAYLYLSMSSYASSQGLRGAATWFSVQYQEELAHGRRMYDYVESQAGRVVLDAIAAPPSEFDSILGAYETTLQHEQEVTRRVNELVNLAVDEKDHATQIFLQWFVSEQVEEEENVQEIIDQLRLAGSGGGLFMIDKELRSRVYVVPPIP